MVLEKRQENPDETSPASASTSTAKEKKKRASSSLSQLILQAFETQSNPRKTLSLAALKKFLTGAGYNLNKNNMRLKRELRILVSNGLLIRVTGSGASGSFKFGKYPTKKDSTKSEKVKAKKVAAKKAETKRQAKKTRKKQPAVNKPKGLQGKKSANPGKKRQLIKHPPGKLN